jgi:very-short-patch-repair endonuclease
VSLESVRIEWWQHLIGFCSLQCDAVYHAKDKFKRNEQDKLILEEHGPELVEAFSYARFVQSESLALLQWQSLSFDRFIDSNPGAQTSLHRYRQENAPPEYKDEYLQTYLRLCQEMEKRQKLGLPEDAPLPEKTIPLTTEAPIKLWLEKYNIEFETQKYFEISDTFTLVDFFIPLPSPDIGICLYCDGDYWHGPEFPETQEKDKMQTKELEKLGHIVIRLWESDIENGIRPIEILELVKIL